MITRRNLILAGAAVVGHAAVAGAVDAPAASPGPNAALASAAAECVRVGEACLQHCLDLLAKGDTSLGECAQMVNQMLAVCRAVGPIVDANGKYVKATAQLCASICTDCEAACRKHAEHHAICKQCAEACATVVKAAKAIA